MAEKKKPTVYKFPKTMGACADAYFKLTLRKSEAQKVVDAIDDEIAAFKKHIIDNLPKSEATGVSGKLANVIVTTKDIPKVDDWEAFYKHVKKTGNFFLLQKRLSDAAIKDIWESNKEVPGVGHFSVTSLSLKKLK